MSRLSARATPTVLALALAAGGLLLAGCGQEVPAPGPRLGGAQAALKEAQGFESANSLTEAAGYYRRAKAQAEALIADLVPGDPALVEARKVQTEASAGLARVMEQSRLRQARAAAGGGSQGVEVTQYTVKSLLPPVLAYTPPPPEPPKPDPTTPQPGNGETPRPPDGQEPGPEPTTPEPPPEPEKPVPVRISKVLVKSDGKTVLVYWKFTNLSGNTVNIGAPMAYILNKSGSRLTTFRQHFLAENFELNATDPLASRGTAVTPDSVTLQADAVKEIVTVGTTTQAKQVGGARVIVRMSDGSDPKGELLEATRE
jgi:hypothetical protein